MRTTTLLAIPLLLTLGAAQPASDPASKASIPAPAHTEPAPEEPGQLKSVTDSAGRIASQPARDIGAAKTNIPPVLVAALDNPYDLRGIYSCRQVAAAFHDLTDVLGPDFRLGSEKKENRAGKLAEAGGQTVVNSFIPFRGLVRELTGAAPAQRRLNRALDAGYARRGFLRGIYMTRKCKSPPLF